MDNYNNIVNAINSAMPIVHSGISSLVGGFITAMFLRGNTNRAEFEKIKAGKIDEALDDLVDSGELTLTELVKCKNILTIAKLADEKYLIRSHDEKFKKEKKDFSFEWFIRFFEAASQFTIAEFQILWANLLANGLDNPEHIHPLFIEIIKQLSKKDVFILQKYLSSDNEKTVSKSYIFDLLAVEPMMKKTISIFSNYMAEKHLPQEMTFEEMAFSLNNLRRLGLIEFYEHEIIDGRRKTYKRDAIEIDISVELQDIIDEIHKKFPNLNSKFSEEIDLYIFNKITIIHKSMMLSDIGKVFIKSVLH